MGFLKGNIPHNKGIKGVMVIWNKGTKGIMKPNKTSIKKGTRLSPATEFKQNDIPWNKGMPVSAETKEKLSIALKGRSSWNRINLSGKIIVLGTNLTNGGQVSCGCFSAEQARDRLIKPHGEASFNSHYYRYKRWAKKRSIQFSLSINEFKDIIIKPCYYCGDFPTERISKRKHNGYFIGHGIDRVNNDIGYTISNSVSCCKHCNIAKSTLSIGDFLTLIKNIYSKHILSKGGE